jgi:hypothetical protein
LTTLHLAGPLAAASNGALYVTDILPGLAGASTLPRERIVVRLASGRFRVVAGDGIPGFSGDGGPAVRAELSEVWDLLVARNGTLYIADGGRVRVVGRDGVIRTIAGDGRAPRAMPDGTFGMVASGTRALAAPLGSEHTSSPLSIAQSPSGQLYIATASQILRLTDHGTLDVVPTVVAAGPAGGSLNSIGSIAIGPHGTIDVGTLDRGWSLWQVAPDGAAHELGYARGAGGNYAVVKRGPGGVVYGQDGGAIVRIAGDRLIPAFRFNRRLRDQWFEATYFATGPTGTLYADDLPPSGGVDTQQQLLSVTDGHIRLLWQEAKHP